MIVSVNCSATGPVQPGIVDTVCKELIGHLSQVYRENQFVVADQVGPGPSLSVRLSKLTKHSMSIKLVWRAKDGRTVEGDDMSLVASDHEINPAMRASLYEQATSRTPMPR